MRTLKHILIASLFLLFRHNCSAQPERKFEEWGQVTLSDLKVTECSFEKDADAILLIDKGDVSYDKADFKWDGKLRINTVYYQRFKILTEKGTSHANFKLRYRITGNEKIDGIKAICYNLQADGSISKTELSDTAIYNTKLNKYENEVVFRVPGVKRGSVFEVTHTRGQDVTYTLPSWRFNTSIPTLHCELTVNFLDVLSYYTLEHFVNCHYNKDSIHYTSDISLPKASGFGSAKAGGTRITYTAENLHSVHAEPFMNSVRNYTGTVSFQLKETKPPFPENNSLITSYYAYNRYLQKLPNFLDNMQGEGIPAKLWHKVIEPSMSKEDKAKAIFDFVRQNMQWNNTLSIAPQHPNFDVWKDKTGSSAEINLLLINTLQAAGIYAQPALLRFRENGYPAIRYPMLDQFNTLVAYVDLGEGSQYVIDATDKTSPFTLPKFDMLNTFVYVMRENITYTWQQSFSAPTSTETTNIIAELGTDGLIHGQVNANFNNYGALNLRRMKASGNNQAIEEEFKKKMPGATMELMSDSANDANNRFYETIKFSKPALGDNDGNFYVNLPDIYSHSDNQFVLPERISDVDFGYKRKISASLVLTVPDNFTVDSLIPAVEYITSDSSISFIIQSQIIDNNLYISQKLEYKKSLYPASFYSEFYDFHQKYYKLSQQAIMLRKKS